MNKTKYILGVVFLASFGGAFTLTSTVFGQVQSGSNISIVQTSGSFVSHSSHGGRYSFNYPQTWVADEQSNNAFPYARISNLDPDNANTDPKFYKIEIVTLPNPDNLSLVDWVQNHIATEDSAPEIVSQTDMQVGGFPAIYVVEKVGSFVFPVVYILKDGNVYLIDGNSVDAEFVSTLKVVLNSFAFI